MESVNLATKCAGRLILGVIYSFFLLYSRLLWLVLISVSRFSAPSPPLNIRYTNLTSSSAVIMWAKPHEPNGPIDEYKIIVNLAEDFTVNSSIYRYTLWNLTSYLNHSINVEACNNNLCSNNSDAVEFTTKISTPGRMKMPRHSITNSSIAVIEWDPPSKPNGPIDYYILHVRPENDPNVSTSETSLVRGEYLNKSLDLRCDTDDRFRPFMVSIQAVNVVEGKELIGPISDPAKVSCLAFNGNGCFLKLKVASCKFLNF